MQRIRVVAGAILREGRVLVALRAPTGPLPDLWELPGGKVEPDERDRDALARELYEELAVRVRVGEHLGESVHGRVHLVAFACTLVEGEPRAIEHREIRWIEPGQMGDLAWAPADLPLLDAVRRACESSASSASPPL